MKGTKLNGWLACAAVLAAAVATMPGAALAGTLPMSQAASVFSLDMLAMAGSVLIIVALIFGVLWALNVTMIPPAITGLFIAGGFLGAGVVTLTALGFTVGGGGGDLSGYVAPVIEAAL